MRKIAGKILKIWIILLVLLQGCGTSPVAEETPIPVVVPSFGIPTNTPTKTVVVLPTPTRTIAPSTTPTVFPTRNVPEAEIKAYWQTVVATNGGCDLPCFLGLHPGKSVWDDVEKLYEPVEDVSMYKPESSDYMAYPWHELPFICLSRCEYHEFQKDIQVEAGIITSFSARTEMIGRDPEVAKALEAYRLENILAKYGEPSRVWLRLVPFPNHKDVEPHYTLVVFYDDQGILVDYWVKV